MAKILVVEDDQPLVKAIKDWLAAEKHVLEFQSDGSEALELIRFYSYDVIVLDWNLPSLPGVEVCRRFRAAGGKTPIIMLTGMNQLHDKQAGFDAGADDYLTKPFEMEELSMRLRALLRRPQTFVEKESKLEFGDITIDAQNHTAFKGGMQIHLLPKEHALLQFFLSHPDQVFSANAILDRVWPSHSDMSPDSVRIYVARLRSKIDTKGTPSYIKTVHGVGYKLSADNK